MKVKSGNPKEKPHLISVEKSTITDCINQIPREDAAEVVVKVLTTPEALNRSFDLSKPPGEGTVFNGDLAALLANLNGGNCKYDEPEWP